jgi:hypothetical protein
MQRAQGLVSRLASAASTPMVPTPLQTPSQSSYNLNAPPASMRKLTLSPGGSPALGPDSKKGSEGLGSESGASDLESAAASSAAPLSASAKVGRGLSAAWAFIKKWSGRGARRFVDWLDEEGAQREHADESLIDMDSSSSSDDDHAVVGADIGGGVMVGIGGGIITRDQSPAKASPSKPDQDKQEKDDANKKYKSSKEMPKPTSGIFLPP